MNYQLIHTCLQVSDLDASIKFYTEALHHKVVRQVSRPEIARKLAFVSDGTSGHQIELMSNEGQIVKDNQKSFSHIAMTTDYLEKSHNFHQSLGYHVTEIYTVNPNVEPDRYMLSDPDGYLIEIVKRT